MGTAPPGEPIGQGPAKMAPNIVNEDSEDGELDRLLLAARTCRNRLIAPIVLLAIETGMRRRRNSQLRGNTSKRTYHRCFIPHTKNGHSRLIPLTTGVIKILNGCQSNSHACFQ